MYRKHNVISVATGTLACVPSCTRCSCKDSQQIFLVLMSSLVTFIPVKKNKGILNLGYSHNYIIVDLKQHIRS